jgi:two-component system, sensor histidine kinase
MASLFERQVNEATGPDGSVDMARLGVLVSQAYEDEARARRRLDRAMHLMNEELEEKNAEIASQAEKSVLRFIVSAAFPLAVTDRDGLILVANRKVCELFGQTSDSLRGRKLHSLLGIDPDHDFSVASELDKFEYTAPDGEIRTLYAEIAPARVAENSYLIASFRDETERERHLSEVEAARALADEANLAKSSFLAMMSHELRTPLNAMLGSADLLGRTNLDARQTELLSMFREAGGLMLALVGDVLDFAKIEAGQLELNPQPMLLGALANDITGMWAGEAERRGLSLDVDVSGLGGVAVSADVMRLRQIVFNLVSNGLKFTAKGGVKVTFASTTVSARETVTICVADTGIGIPADRLDRIFDAFVQADVSITRQFGGTGLGLPISRSLARQMGGDLTVTSNGGAGSTFTVTLELDHAEMIKTDAVTVTDDSIEQHIRVLAVEDNELNRRILGAILELCDTEVAWAENGVEAVAQATQNRFDVILMDVQMPVMDGITATRTIRAGGGPNSNTPIIALTANVSLKDQANYVDSGMNLFVAKPIQPSHLLHVMSQALATNDADGITCAA